jgi:hypothetical protein
MKPSPRLRGYGAEHRAVRASLAPLVASGAAVCVRCGEPIAPGAPWDLGHTDDRLGWTGPEHQRCNRQAGAIVGGRRRRGDPPPSRSW